MHARLWTVVLALALKTASGQFAEKPTCVIEGLSGPFNLTVGDLNNDGKPDLVITSWVRVPGPKEAYDHSKSRVNVYYQKDGTFRTPADKAFVLKRPTGVAVGDFDKDGKHDLVVGANKTLHLFLGSENLEKDHECADSNGGGGVMHPCRLNKDGLCDFLSGPVWLKWFGGDRFRHGYLSGPKVNDNEDSLPADFNHDGEPDILVKSRDTKTLRINYGPLLAMSVKPQDLWQFVTLAAPLPLSVMVVGDLNGDGLPDLIHSDGRNVVCVFQNRGAKRPLP